MQFVQAAKAEVLLEQDNKENAGQEAAVTTEGTITSCQAQIQQRQMADNRARGPQLDSTGEDHVLCLRFLSTCSLPDN